MSDIFSAAELKTQRNKLVLSLSKINENTEVIPEIKLPEKNQPDLYDRAAVESDRDLDIRIKERENKLANKIKKAIERIDNGTYQICKECGETIPKSRLVARSVTELCITCKEVEEQNERIA